MLTNSIISARYFSFIFLFLFICNNTFAFAADENFPVKKNLNFDCLSFGIVVDPPNTNGEANVYAVENTGVLAPTAIDKYYFFVIMPDGNFLTLTKSVGYRTTYKFQKDAIGIVNYPVGNIQAWVFKKNDPTPPPAQAPISSNGGSNVSLSGNTTSYTANGFLDAGTQIKIGTSWGPWIHSSGQSYYFLVVSFSHMATATDTINGVVQIENCAPPPASTTARFTPTEYIAYNLAGDKSWNQNTVSTGLSFPFSNLKPGEVRHIYLKMADNGSQSTNVPQFKAILNSKDTQNNITFIASTDCLESLLYGSPYDPNSKIVDQPNCTFDGCGVLTYTVTFQNEGTGFTKEVIIEDEFPSQISSRSVRMVSHSKNIPVYKINQRFPPKNTACFYLGNSSAPFYLPGLTQTQLRRYTFDETIGWIKFSVDATCPGKTNPSPFFNDAQIIFVDAKNGTKLDPVVTDKAITTPTEAALSGWVAGNCRLKWWQRLFNIKKR